MGAPICPACRQKAEDDYQKVKQYIRDNPGVGVYEVSVECEVDQQQIRQWIREERLEFAEGSAVDLSCEKCGVAIRTGRFCDKCKASMINTMNDTFSRLKPKQEVHKDTKENPRMRFLDK